MLYLEGQGLYKGMTKLKPQKREQLTFGEYIPRFTVAAF
jgi:hypothetical protein